VTLNLKRNEGQRKNVELMNDVIVEREGAIDINCENNMTRAGEVQERP
jgi:hypothetical protein